ncbi:MAG: hypothetical protein AB7R69_01665 [Candidatus Babeliales bacterium]
MKKCLALLLLLSLSAAQAMDEQTRKAELQKLEKDHEKLTRHVNNIQTLGLGTLMILLDPDHGAKTAIDLGIHPNTVVPIILPFDKKEDTDVMGATTFSILTRAKSIEECPLEGLKLLLQKKGDPNATKTYAWHKTGSLLQIPGSSFSENNVRTLTAQELLTSLRADSDYKTKPVISCANQIQELFDEKKQRLDKRKQLVNKKNL